MIDSKEIEIVLFDAARELSDAETRKAFLAQACNGDAKLRERLEKLLAVQVDAEDFFSKGVGQPAATDAKVDDLASSPFVSLQPAPVETIGTIIGRYRLLERLGEGGCGVVYLAEQEKPIQRKVALKIIRLGMDTENVIARFEAERQALALMEHPNIARVIDAGTTNSGRPYFVMELVTGMKVTEFCDQNHLDIPQRLHLFIQICHAIQHAHQKGIIHRDIKPANIIVALQNGNPLPKVIDFGIAKAVEGRLVDHKMDTASDQFVGTPAYMSPEQAERNGLDVDTRSDVYSLGALLYELLTGRTPFDSKQLINSGVEEIRRTLREHEPQVPSTMLTRLGETQITEIAALHNTEPPRLISSVKGDLDWIVMKAMDKDRQRRYETVNGLALDVRRFLDNEPVYARPPSRLYRLQKLIRRNIIVFALSGVVVVTLLIGIVVSTKLWLKEREALKQVVAEQQQKFAVQQDNIHLENLRQMAEEGRKFAQASALARQGKWNEADNLLDEIPKYNANPDDASVFRLIGDWDAQQHRWAKALNRFSVLDQINQLTNTSNYLDDFRFGVVLVDQGEQVKYEGFRKSVIARYAANSADPLMDARVLRVCLIGSADGEVITALQPFNDRTVLAIQTRIDKIGRQAGAWCAYSVALMAYRSGDFAAATNWCDFALNQNHDLPVRDFCVRLVRAMALANLGQTDEAHKEIIAVRQAVESEINEFPVRPRQWHGYWFDWATIRIFLREASALDGQY